MLPNAKQYSRHVEVVGAALDILECFLHESPLSLKAMTERTGLTRNRTMRIAGTLAARGYLTRDTVTRHFRLGPQTATIAQAYIQGFNLIDAVRPILRRLADQTGEVAVVAVREGLERVVLAKEEGPHEVRYSIPIGQRCPLHLGSSAKVLLAYAPMEIREAFLKKESLPGTTANSITDPTYLASELARIKIQGFAESIGERIEEAASVAAPVFDFQGQIICALSLAAPINRMDRDQRHRYANFIKSASYELVSPPGHLRSISY